MSRLVPSRIAFRFSSNVPSHRHDSRNSITPNSKAVPCYVGLGIGTRGTDVQNTHRGKLSNAVAGFVYRYYSTVTWADTRRQVEVG